MNDGGKTLKRRARIAADRSREAGSVGTERSPVGQFKLDHASTFLTRLCKIFGHGDSGESF